MSSLPHSVRFILATIVIDAIGFGIIMPVMPALLMDVGGLDVSAAARFGGLLALLYAAFQFLLGPTLGNFSDRYGRRPVLLGSLAGYSLNFAVMAAAPNLGWLIAGQALAGVFGGTYGPAQAALADVTEPKDRARAFGYVGAAFGVGFTLGPLIGGVLGEFGPRMPFYAAAALAAINFIYGMTIFPETLSAENRRGFDWRRANPLGAFRALGHLPGIIPLGGALLLWQIASLVYPLTWGYYLIAAFDATPRAIGLTLTIVGVSMASVQFFATGRIVAHFGERRAAIIGLSAAGLAFVGFALIPAYLPALILCLAMPFGSLVQPTLSALVSRRGRADNQGEIQGFTSSILSLGAMLAPVILNPTLAYFTAPGDSLHVPGAAFVVATLFVMATLAIVMRMRTDPSTE
jgi:MFS transporter, DHA1 family, tetracycline resistance protein